MRPFYLYGSLIKLYQYALTYTTPETENEEGEVIPSETKTTYFPDLDSLEEGQLILEKLEGCTGFSSAPLDTNNVAWLEDIDVGEEQSIEKAVEIWEMGEEAYRDSLNIPTIEDYLVDLDYRMSKAELGL